MYNEKRKQDYLDIKSADYTQSTNLRDMFVRSEQREEKYGRDIAEWTSDEIISFYKYTSTYSIQSLVQAHNGLTDYTNWCILNGMVSDNQNHFSEIKTDILCTCVDSNRLKTMVVTRPQLLEALSKMVNATDKFIFLGLFEGIPFGDLLTCKESDLDDKTNNLTLSNGYIITISDELCHILHTAANQKEYISYSIARPRHVDYGDGSTVIRRTVRKNGEPTTCTMTVMIGRQMRIAAKETGLSDNLTFKTIKESGRLHYIHYVMEKEMGYTFEDCITSGKLRPIHEKIFGKIQNSITYLGTYGSIYNEVYKSLDS